MRKIVLDELLCGRPGRRQFFATATLTKMCGCCWGNYTRDWVLRLARQSDARVWGDNFCSSSAPRFDIKLCRIKNFSLSLQRQLFLILAALWASCSTPRFANAECIPVSSRDACTRGDEYNLIRSFFLLFKHRRAVCSDCGVFINRGFFTSQFHF